MIEYWLEVSSVAKLTIRISQDVHEKLRWVAYKKRRSQQDILTEVIEKALADVEVPKEARE